MKKHLLLLACAAGLISIIPSCTHDPILPDQQVSFANDIQPIMRGSCQFSGCHDTLGNGEARPIDSYDDMMRGNRVVAGKPHKSDIYNRVIITGGGEEAMPRSPYIHLTDRQIKLLYVWIAQGAKNN